ncbi:hypothetical protein BN949_05510 [Agrobacterium tumefaciens]|nr:hypothetical protein BN949_05510 [Agrobacterium tumefaciens]
MTVLQVCCGRFEKSRRLHRRQEMIEEALLGAFESGARSSLGIFVQRDGFAGRAGRTSDAGGFHRSIEMVVDHLERLGIGVVDADLFLGEFLLEDLVFDAFEGERARCVEAHGLEVASEYFHCRNTAVFDRGNELGTGRKGKVAAAPEAEALGIGERLHFRRAGRGDVDDTSIRQSALQAEPCPALLRRRLVAAFGLAAGGVGHGMAFIENDNAIKIGAEPIDDLLHA